jgi:hypothetical protein
VNSLERDRRISGTTLLAVYVIVGQVLGMSLGGLKASRQVQAHISIHSAVYAPDSDPDGQDDEDTDEHDPFVVWPLLGLVSGTMVGASAAEIHLVTRRAHRERTRVD